MSKILLTTFVFLLVSGCTTTHSRKHKDFNAESFQAIKKVGVLPIQVMVTEVTPDDSGGRLTEREEIIAEDILDRIVDWLEKHGFATTTRDKTNLSAVDVFSINQMSDATKTNTRELYSSWFPTKTRDEIFAYKTEASIGATAANTVADIYNSDYLFVTYIDWYVRSDEQMKREAIKALFAMLFGAATISSQDQSVMNNSVGELGTTAGIPREFGSMRGVLVDGNSGKILWTNWFDAGYRTGGGYEKMITNFKRIKINPVEIKGENNAEHFSNDTEQN